MENSGFFPSINQFRNTVKAERDWAEYHNEKPRVRKFLGTVKLHGTNAGITLNTGGEIQYRSRSRIITPDDDNYGFARSMSVHEGDIRDMLSGFESDITVFGEWCGAGVQSNVGISAEQKMFVIFAAKLEDGYLDHATTAAFSKPECRIFNIYDFPVRSIDIDFSNPETVQNDLVAMTEEVERECPVAKSFGHTGIGEGIVWTPVDGDRDSRYWFKVKGEKHSSSKVKVLASVDVERFRKRDDLVASLVTENRLKQGLDLHKNEFGRSLEMKEIGEFLRWVFNDILKEDSDTITESGFEIKEMGKPISDIAKRYYIDAVAGASL